MESVEAHVRTSNWSNSPDWMYMKAIKASRLIDDTDSPEIAVYYLLQQTLFLERRVRALEALIKDTPYAH